MTDHSTLKMHREHVRITDRAMLSAILDLCEVANVGLHDEPYPYTVPMNFGYEWQGDNLVFYLHMAFEGHRIELIKQDPKVSVCCWTFLDRVGHKPFQRETHDYRSIMAYGEAEILTYEENPEEYIKALSMLHQKSGRPPIKKMPKAMTDRLRGLKITCPAELVSAKAQYDIFTVDEVPMPSLEDVDEGRVYDPKKAQPDKPYEPHARDE